MVMEITPEQRQYAGQLIPPAAMQMEALVAQIQAGLLNPQDPAVVQHLAFLQDRVTQENQEYQRMAEREMLNEKLGRVIQSFAENNSTGNRGGTKSLPGIARAPQASKSSDTVKGGFVDKAEANTATGRSNPASLAGRGGMEKTSKDKTHTEGKAGVSTSTIGGVSALGSLLAAIDPTAGQHQSAPTLGGSAPSRGNVAPGRTLEVLHMLGRGSQTPVPTFGRNIAGL